MSVKTNNVYGKITISDNTIEKFVSHIALDSYGVVKFSPISMWGRFSRCLNPRLDVKGVKIRTSGDRIIISLSVFVKYGVSIKAVIEALKESVKYKVERFSGMIVDTINVTVVGVEK